MSTSPSKTNPILIIAAISVILFSGVGIAVMTGVIPDSFSKNTQSDAIQLSEAKPASRVEIPAAITANAQPPATVAEKPITGMAGESRPASTVAKKSPAPSTARSSQKVVNDRVAMNEVAPARVCDNCGVVSSVDVIQEAGEGSGLGAVAGAVGGGLLGNQIGGGSGKKIATVAGILGGGLAGHQIEKQVKKTTRYDILVKMETGGYRTFTEATDPGLASGDKVKVEGGDLVKE
ncbi:MAG: glycine zipper 2TM domain-containing protein [Burkholderiales bacterium]|nr:glycine zipper 2TM domain-containing protein [Burkholderiales bacterium]